MILWSPNIFRHPSSQDAFAGLPPRAELPVADRSGQVAALDAAAGDARLDSLMFAAIAETATRQCGECLHAGARTVEDMRRLVRPNGLGRLIFALYGLRRVDRANRGMQYEIGRMPIHALYRWGLRKGLGAGSTAVD